ncbi:MAG TPA: lactate utilization protein [Blastocatellia bacterium]|nr:lactate utilization protein [Blastocatellia bacterium]
MTAREEILAKIKSALGNSDAAPLPALAALSPQQVMLDCEAQRDALVQRFEAMLTRAGGYFSTAASPQAVCDRVAEIAAGTRAKKAVGWHSQSLEQPGVAARLAEMNIEFAAGGAGADKAAFIRQAAEATLGITPVDYALSDSGTLCLLAGENRPRTASLLPPVHIAILRPEQILRGLDDLFALLPAGGDLSSAVTLITGPSRTADIELTLVVGVHGPQQLHVVLANY